MHLVHRTWFFDGTKMESTSIKPKPQGNITAYVSSFNPSKEKKIHIFAILFDSHIAGKNESIIVIRIDVMHGKRL